MAAIFDRKAGQMTRLFRSLLRPARNRANLRSDYRISTAIRGSENVAALPGWNSLESVTRIHAWLEITGIAVLVLLLLSQGLAYSYGVRKDLLANTDATAHRTKEAELQQKLSAADAQLQSKTAPTQAAEAPRRLSMELQQRLIKALAPFKGQKFTTTSVIGDEEGNAFAQDFQAVFDAAGWDHGVHDKVDHRYITPTPVGVMVAMNEGEANAGRFLPAIETLISTLQKIGIMSRNELLVNSEVPVGEINLIVGYKQASP
jgi:hypothetical protein